MKTLSIYIHIPFCVQKCNYCDFYSVPNVNEKLKEQYLEAIEKHIDEYKNQTAAYTVRSVYFGGGTPSLLSGAQLRQLMNKIKASFRLAKDCEISTEINPGTVDLKKLRAIRRAGFNRLSIGVQSFVQNDLEICGRIHSVNDNVYAIRAAQKAGFFNISTDVLYGLPEQKLDHVLETIRFLISVSPDHISLYGLKVEEGTPFHDKKDLLVFPHEDIEREMYFVADKLLTDAGYNHYEISNFAKKGKACRHNLRYWNCDEYLGFGPGAHSYFAGKRFSFKKDIGVYINSFVKDENVELLLDEMIDIPAHTRMAEYVMLRFRLAEGINCDSFYKRFGRSFESVYLDRIIPYLNSGHMLKTRRGYALTVEGMYVSNYILARIVDFDLITPGTN